MKNYSNTEQRYIKTETAPTKPIGFIKKAQQKTMNNFNSTNQNQDLEKDDYALLSKALKDWDEESKEIYDRTEKLIMMK